MRADVPLVVAGNGHTGRRGWEEAAECDAWRDTEVRMASVSHEPVRYGSERPQWAEFLRIPELWASVAIVAMWLAVLFDAVYGPSFVSTSGASTTTIPSAIFVALFALLGTVSVAKYGFRHDKQ